MSLLGGTANAAATGIGGALTALSDVMGTAIQGAGGILKFGLRHPILSGIAGVIAYKGISGAFNAKAGESVGVAAAKGIGDLFGSVKNYAGIVTGGVKDMAADFSEKAQDIYSNNFKIKDAEGNEVAKISYADPDQTLNKTFDYEASVKNSGSETEVETEKGSSAGYGYA